MTEELKGSGRKQAAKRQIYCPFTAQPRLTRRHEKPLLYAPKKTTGDAVQLNLLMKISKPVVSSTCATLVIGAALFASGCASIVHSGSRTVTVNSQPAGATVTILKADTGAAVHSGATPLTVSLDPKRGYFKGQSYTVRMELDGYRTEEVILRPQLSGWYIGNVLFGGLIGLVIVDPLTGSMWNLSPDKLDRPLTANQAELLRTGSGFMVSLLADTTPEERAQMVRIN